MKNVVLLGSTGSIGTSTIKVAEDLPDQNPPAGAGGREQRGVAPGPDPQASARGHFHQPIRPRRANCATRWARAPRFSPAPKGCVKLATLPAADIVLIAIVGTAGLEPALAAIRAGKDIAVASKEILVMAGEIVMREAREHGVNVLAVDSEHSAIFQCLDGKPAGSVRRLWLTASGGPFRTTPKEEFAGHHRRARLEASLLGHGPQDHH